MTLAAVAIGATVVSGFIGAMGQMSAANAQAAAYEREAQIAERNKIFADQDRKLAIETARIDAEDKARDNRRQLASLRAAYGNTGFELTGSPLEVLADTSIEMALDERRIEFEGMARGREGAIKMLGLQDEADMSRAAGKNAKKAGKISAISTLIGTAGSAAKTKYDMGNA